MRTVSTVASILGILAISSTWTLAADYFADVAPGGCDESVYCDSSNCSCSHESPECHGYCNNCEGILGILPSDHCFDRFVSPLSNPYFFEDPRSLTEVRGIYLDNSLPDSIGGGDAQVWAAQVRLRLSERWSVIAPRLGYLEVNPSGDGAPEGFLSAPVGVKYNFIRDVERQSVVSGGVTYFIPGSSDALSNFGDGDFHFFLTGGQEIFERGHWLSGTGFRIPADHNWGTQLWYWSNQWDYEVVDHWYGLLGVNWFHWMRSAASGAPSPVTALDLINFPVSGVAGTDVVTGMAGVKWKPSSHIEFGSGFEFPMTDRTDILHNRLYVDLIFRY